MKESLYQHFEILEDPRSNIGKRHELINIIIMSIYGILVGQTDCVSIADFIKIKEDYFIELLNLENGVPSHDTLSRVFGVINPKEFMNIFIEWIKTVVKDKGKFLNIDGKAVRSATSKINNGNIPYIVSGFIADLGVSIGQVKVDDKSNEITAIPELLDLIDIEGLTVTIDAIGTQENIANQIVDKNAHYVLKVKDNQKDLKDDIKTYFDLGLKELNNDEIKPYITSFEKDHGRIEQREYYLSYNTDCIHNKEKWKSVNAIAFVRTYREEIDKVDKKGNPLINISEDYFIIDNKINLDYLVKALRSHWSIECSLHWRLDVIFDEDHSRSRIGDSIENLSALRKIVFNLVRLDTSLGSKISVRKKLTNYTFNFKLIENLLFKVIPSL